MFQRTWVAEILVDRQAWWQCFSNSAHQTPALVSITSPMRRRWSTLFWVGRGWSLVIWIFCKSSEWSWQAPMFENQSSVPRSECYFWYFIFLRFHLFSSIKLSGKKGRKTLFLLYFLRVMGEANRCWAPPALPGNLVYRFHIIFIRPHQHLGSALRFGAKSYIVLSS